MKLFGKPYFDPFIILPIVYLSIISLVTLRSIELTNNAPTELSVGTQLLALLVGTIGLFIAQRSQTVWYRLSILFYAVSIGLLITVLLIGSTNGGATRWIELGSFQFQPSEVAKFALVLVQARLLARRTSILNKPWPLLLSALYTAIPLMLIVTQPDIGTAVILAGLWLAQLLTSELPKRTFLLVLGLMLLIIPASYPFLADYQQERIDSFFNPSLDTQDEGYNVLQASIAIGSGGFWGKGLDSGTQSQLNFLPAQHTDFVFAVIAEKLGFIGAVTVIVALVVLLIRLVYKAWSTSSQFARLFGIGVVATLGLQFMINIGMNLGLVPVTGVPLPFVSSGGTHLAVELIMIGVFLGLVSRDPV
jgi:rod shape determining protein RodA